MVALQGRINIRCQEERVQRYDEAARRVGMTRSEFMLKTCDAMANKVLGPERTGEVHASSAVPKVAEKVRSEAPRRPTLSELMQPGNKHYDRYCALAKDRSADDFVDYLGDDVDYQDDRPRPGI